MMLYRYYLRDCIDAGITPVRVVRKAVASGGALLELANEEPTGPNRQVLLMAGREGRDKVPLLVNDDTSVANIVGSVMLRTQGQRLVGILGWATDKRATDVKQRYLAGELVPNLITEPIAGIELRRGEFFGAVDGPAIVLTSWEPLQCVLRG
jgi:hypothetical protein